MNCGKIIPFPLQKKLKTQAPAPTAVHVQLWGFLPCPVTNHKTIFTTIDAKYEWFILVNENLVTRNQGFLSKQQRKVYRRAITSVQKLFSKIRFRCRYEH